SSPPRACATSTGAWRRAATTTATAWTTCSGATPAPAPTRSGCRPTAATSRPPAACPTPPGRSCPDRCPGRTEGPRATAALRGLPVPVRGEEVAVRIEQLQHVRQQVLHRPQPRLGGEQGRHVADLAVEQAQEPVRLQPGEEFPVPDAARARIAPHHGLADGTLFPCEDAQVRSMPAGLPRFVDVVHQAGQPLVRLRVAEVECEDLRPDELGPRHVL